MTVAIEGIFSENKPDESFEQFLVYPKIGELYITAKQFILGDKGFYLFMKNIPSFEEVYCSFMDCSIAFLGLDKKQDICLSLFYDPYFEEVYEKLKHNYCNISKNRKKFLLKYFFNYLADPITNSIFSKWNLDGKNNYVDKGMYYKSREIIKLLK